MKKTVKNFERERETQRKLLQKTSRSGQLPDVLTVRATDPTAEKWKLIKQQ